MKFVERPIRGEYVADVAKRIFMGGEPHVGGYVDAPVNDVLALVITGCQPQYLNDAAGGRVIAVDRFVSDAQAHETSSNRTKTGRAIDQINLRCPDDCRSPP